MSFYFELGGWLGLGFLVLFFDFIGISTTNKIEDKVINKTILNLIPTTNPKIHILKNNSFILVYLIS